MFDIQPRRDDSTCSRTFVPLSNIQQTHGLRGHVMTRQQERVNARMPKADEARHLQLQPGVPVLDVLHTSIDQDGNAYEVTRFVMRADLTGLFYDIPVE